MSMILHVWVSVTEMPISSKLPHFTHCVVDYFSQHYRLTIQTVESNWLLLSVAHCLNLKLSKSIIIQAEMTSISREALVHDINL